MNIVCYGGGTNSTALIIGMYKKRIPIDLILFADTGAEMPHTYKFIDIFNEWLKIHSMPQIIVVKKIDKSGERLTLEQECLQCKVLPSIAYGYKRCSLKHKAGVQEKYCNNYQPCKKVWKNGEKIYKYIGFDAGEENRILNARTINLTNKKYENVCALYDWGWWREDCIEVIKKEGLPQPGKSSCFFCPSMKKYEIDDLRKNHPELFKRAIAIEESAKENLITVKGLGRNWSWKDYAEAKDKQLTICDFFDPEDAPCGCYDG